MPSCDPGDRAAPSQADGCKEVAGLIRCYPRELCGTTVWCAQYAPCPYPSCPGGYTTVPDAGTCPPGEDCTSAVPPDGMSCQPLPITCHAVKDGG